MKSSVIASVFLSLPVAGMLIGCSYLGLAEYSSAEMRDMNLVLETVRPNLADDPAWDIIMFSMGELEGGCAVMVENGDQSRGRHMFWVQNGVVYAVNDAAKNLAPQQPAAPASVTYEKAVAVVH